MDGSDLLRLVTDPKRQALLSELRGAERTVGHLVTALRDEQSNVSHHLASLRHAGLVASRKSGRQQLYRIADPEIAKILAQLDEMGVQLDRACYWARIGLPGDAGFHGYG